VRNDTWFASAENRGFVKASLRKDFVMPLRESRRITQDAPSVPNRRYVPVSEFALAIYLPLCCSRKIWQANKSPLSHSVGEGVGGEG